MTGRIIAKGPHECDQPRWTGARGDIWQCDDCNRTWRCVYIPGGVTRWHREMPWSRWLRERRPRRVGTEPMGETG